MKAKITYEQFYFTVAPKIRIIGDMFMSKKNLVMSTICLLTNGKIVQLT